MGEYFKNIWLGVWTVLVGMKITLEHLFAKKVTNQYPDRWHPIEGKFSGTRSFRKGDEDRSDIPSYSRNRLYVDMNICNGCNGCARACPVNCITVETLKVTPGDKVEPLGDGSKRGLWVTKHDIDFAKCCFCGLCTEPCPTEAIYMTKEFEYATEKRDDLVYHFAVMTPEEIQEKKDMYEKFMADKKKQAAAGAAPAPKEEEEDHDHDH